MAQTREAAIVGIHEYPLRVAPGVSALPVGLRKNCDLEAMMREPTSKNRRGKRRVVDIGVSGDKNHVGLIPAECIDLLAPSGQKDLAGGPGGAVSG